MAKRSTNYLSVGGNLPVSRIINSYDFLIKFRGIRRSYQKKFGPLVSRVREYYTEKPEEELVDQSLEAHIRVYIVNSFLSALNWRLDEGPENGLPNLVPEVPILSKERGSIRFLDYLGLERTNHDPLMIVETKRPSSQLPHTNKPASVYSEIVSRGLAGEALNGEWNKWLQDIRDYVRSTYECTRKAPLRVVLTNGDWLILFLDPTDAFLKGGTNAPGSILVFSDHSDIEERYHDLFEKLEHGKVLGESPPLTPGELPFYTNGNPIDRALHGLRLRYIEQRSIYKYSPVIIVAPVVFLRTRYGCWLRVETPPQERELPYKADQLPNHIDELDCMAKNLLTEINYRLGVSLQPFPILRHFEDEEGFHAVRGCVESDEDEYLLVTGDKTHYLLQRPAIANCPYHDWATCNAKGVPCDSGPIIGRSTSPRSFFFSEEPHHCAHRDVSSAKGTPITPANRPQCGLRSGQDGQAFCEIWGFEQHLCCQTCIFNETCTRATVFQLPCLSEKNR